MFLSRLRLNPADPAARRDLGDPYELHRTLTRVFAAGPESAPDRFLWRRELAGDSTAGATVLVQSEQRGRWATLAERPGYAWSVEADKPVDLERFIRDARVYRFRLVANPTVTREGKRHGLVREADQLAWVERQASRHGFEVLEAVRGASERIVSRRPGRAAIVVQSVQVDGYLRVTEEGLLRQAVSTGIGHAKALGLGLLSLAPVGRR